MAQKSDFIVTLITQDHTIYRASVEGWDKAGAEEALLELLCENSFLLVRRHGSNCIIPVSRITEASIVEA